MSSLSRTITVVSLLAVLAGMALLLVQPTKASALFAYVVGGTGLLVLLTRTVSARREAQTTAEADG